MGEAEALPTLAGARRIGLLGDVHGDLDALLTAATFMASEDVHVLLVLGDFGLLWNNGHWQGDVKMVSRELASRKVQLAFLDGNHEAFPILNSFPIEADGLRPIAPNITHLPRGYRTTIAGKLVGVMGGANSIDRQHRGPKTWWPEESITEADLEALGDAHVDILFAHDTALDVLSLDRQLAKTDKYWSPAALEYARQGRANLHRAVLQTSPDLLLSGHYHQPIDEVVGYVSSTTAFATRVVILDMLQNEHRASAAILDVAQLDLQFFTFAGTPIPAEEQVTELTLASRGRWLVHTTGSQHLFDFDAGTVERFPGPNTHPTTSDGVQAIRTLDECRIGARGRWTMRAEDFETDYLWHISSAIRHIERMEDNQRAGGSTQPRLDRHDGVAPRRQARTTVARGEVREGRAGPETT